MREDYLEAIALARPRAGSIFVMDGACGHGYERGLDLGSGRRAICKPLKSGRFGWMKRSRGKGQLHAEPAAWRLRALSGGCWKTSAASSFS